MRERRKGIYRLAIEQNIEFDEPPRAVIVQVVVERGISLGDALQFVVEVDYDLAEREVVEEFDTISRDVILLNEHAALTQT